METTITPTTPSCTTTLRTAPPTAARPAPGPWQALSIDSTLVVVEDEYPLREAPSSRRFLALEQVLYSIRLPEQPGETECGRCGERFRAAGPTGHANEEPICDVCLLECEEELGMVLALVSVVRTYASSSFESAEDHWEGLEEVGAFVRIYERVASRSGPPRIFRRYPWRPGS